MKITDQDFQALRAAVIPVLSEVTWQQYKDRGLSAERYRWDSLHRSGFNTVPLYSYLNDDNLDTALRRIIPLT